MAARFVRDSTPLRAIVLVFGLAGWSEAQAEEPAPALTPILGSVLTPPQAVPGSDGRTHLVYEVRVTNATGGEISVERVEVVDEASGKPVSTLDKTAVGTRLTPGAHRGSESSEVGPYQVSVLFVHVVLAESDAVPERLIHRVTARIGDGEPLTMPLASTAVDRRPLVRLGPPLRGSRYIAGDGCCDSVRHVRALLPIDGEWRLAQRFAIDWEQMDDAGRLVSGDLKTPASYQIYGREVIASADGTVVATRNDLPDQVPGALPAHIALDEADGNFVVLAIGAGAHILYAHFQPGSVAVRVGERVRRGDRLGLVGNSGNSQAPHLHMHVMDAPSPLRANGLPYVFESGAVTAVDEAGTSDFDRAEATGSALNLVARTPPIALRGLLPLDLSVVDWANAKP